MRRDGRLGQPQHDEIVFRTLAAPGLDEDDLYAARCASADATWGEGHPTAFPAPEDPSDGASERRRRHEEILRRWEPIDTSRGASGSARAGAWPPTPPEAPG